MCESGRKCFETCYLGGFAALAVCVKAAQLNTDKAISCEER
jgi:hypothetical protein